MHGCRGKQFQRILTLIENKGRHSLNGKMTVRNTVSCTSAGGTSMADYKSPSCRLQSFVVENVTESDYQFMCVICDIKVETTITNGEGTNTLSVHVCDILHKGRNKEIYNKW